MYVHSHTQTIRDEHSGGSDWRGEITAGALALEAWGQGFMVGALVIMGCVTVANMRRGVLLHKLILLELLLAVPHGTFCFMTFKGYGWYLSGTASLLYVSCFVHNIVAWMKIKPFVLDARLLFGSRAGRTVSRIYLTTLGISVVPNLLQIVCNFLFFNGIHDLYERVRPTEFLFRDPWWLLSCFWLFHVVRKTYGSTVIGLIGKSPRLGILLASIVLSMVFTVMDVLAVVVPHVSGGMDGINPYWKLTLVFKCLSDNIMLDDFKTELNKLGTTKSGTQSEVPYLNNRHESFQIDQESWKPPMSEVHAEILGDEEIREERHVQTC